MESKRPVWSVMIPTYNGNPEYIRQTIASVLDQDPGPGKMQIRLVDNGSSKHDYRALVEEIGRGRVEYFRHPETIKYLHNFNSCIEMAEGELVHLLHDDDYVQPGFYETIALAYEKHPEAGYFFTRHQFMNEDGEVFNLSPLESETSGILENWVESIATEQSIYYASIVVPREVYRREGMFDDRFETCAEDWEMWVRLAARYPVYYVREPLANVRIHSSSMSKSLFMNGTLISESRKAIETFDSFLPENRRSRLVRTARSHVAKVAFAYANSYAGSKNVKAAINLARQAVLTTPKTPAALVKSLETGLRILFAMLPLRRPRKSAAA